MRHVIKLGAAALLAFAGPALADDGCSKDSECKGDRICVQRQCVDPEPGTAAAQLRTATDQQAIPAKFEPARGDTPSSAGDSGRPAVLDSTINRHLGTYIRPDLGFGYVRSSASQNGVDASISGFAGTFGIAVGAAITENQILAVHLWDLVATSPTITSGNTTLNNPNATLTFVAIGGEYTGYYAGNVYLSISPALTRGTLAVNGTSQNTSWGFGLRAALGKEWWVSNHWGLGMVGHLSFTANQDTGTNPPMWTSWGATVAFSATYN